MRQQKRLLDVLETIGIRGSRAMLKQLIKITSEQFAVLFGIQLLMNSLLMMGSIIMGYSLWVVVMFWVISILSGVGLFAALDEVGRQQDKE